MASTNVGSIHYDLGLDTSGFEAASARMSKKMTDIGKTMTAAVTLPIVAGMGYAVKAASDLNETLNKVDVAFGDQAKSVREWAKTSIDSMGLAQQSALDAASLFGDMSTAMGLSTLEAKDMSTGLVQLGADMASFKNISFERAQTALAGVYTGETEALKSLGIVMTEQNLQQFAATQGISDNIQKLSQAEKVQLRYAYVMSVTENAQGDFTRTSKGTANQIRITQERFKELSATMGQQLLPYANKALAWSQSMLAAFQKLTPEQQKNVLMFAGLAAVIGPLLIVMAKVVQAIAAIRVALTLLAAHPIMLAVGLLTTIFAALALSIGGAKQTTDTLTLANQRNKTATDALTLAINQQKDATKAVSDAQFELEGANLRVESAQLAYNEAVRMYGPNSLEARQAMYSLKGAQNDVSVAAQNVNNKLSEQVTKINNVTAAQRESNAAKDAVVNASAARQRQIESENRAWANLGFTVADTSKKASGANLALPTGTRLKLPGQNADGTNNWGGGMTWVGEKGPELINLPRGTQIMPNSESLSFMSQMMRGNSTTSRGIKQPSSAQSKGGDINFGGVTINSKDDADYFLSKVDRMQERASMGLTA